MKIPFFDLKNYQSILEKRYDEQNANDWIDIEKLIKIMNDDFVKTFANIDPRNLSNEIKNYNQEINEITSMSIVGDDFSDGESILTFSKLALPTLWICECFSWSIGNGTHHGIDLILPQGTPIQSFSDGKVQKVKEWDGKTKDEGNCVVVKTQDDEYGEIYISYLHLDSINVKENDDIKNGDVLGTCGDTGSSTQYHLHLQIDKNQVPYSPFYSKSKDIDEIQKNTINPLDFLKKLYNISFEEKKSKNSSNKEENQEISDSDSSSKKEEGNTDNKQQEKKQKEDDLIGQITSKLKEKSENSDGVFKDMPKEEKYKLAILKLQENGILNGHEGNIYPEKTITRYAFSLILYRIIKKFNLIEDPVIGKQKFTDINESDEEFVNAVKYLSGNNIINGSGDKFLPDDNLLENNL